MRPALAHLMIRAFDRLLLPLSLRAEVRARLRAACEIAEKQAKVEGIR